MSRNKGPRDDRWYLNLMAPNTKGPKFAWLDPTSIYINGEAFHDLLDDLVADLKGSTCDVVGGLDAMGFVLGSALATRLGVGFLPIRKAGKLCVDTDKVSFSNYSGRTQDMEMRHSRLRQGHEGAAGRPVGGNRRHDGRRHPPRRAAGRHGRRPRRRGHRGECGHGCLSRRSTAACRAWCRAAAGRRNATRRSCRASQSYKPELVFPKVR